MVARISTITGRLVRLTTGSVSALLPVERVLGVERGHRIRRASAAAGMTLDTTLGNFRVIELPELLGVEQKIAQRTGQVILTEVAGERIGILVEKATQLPRSETPRFVSAPALASSGGRISTVVLLSDGPMPLLELDLLFDPDSDSSNAPDVPTRKASVRIPNDSAATRLIVVGQFEYPAPGGRLVGVAIPDRCVEDITDIDEQSPMQSDASHFRGLVEWRGRVLPKVDLAAWCELPSFVNSDTRVVVAQSGDGARVAFIADKKVRGLSINSPHIASRLSLPLRQDRILGLYEFEGITIVIPDISRIAHSA
jgi:chemotaxis signal transduction protein